MNQFPYPIYPNYPYNLIDEINKLKEEINILEQRITKIEKQNKNNYLKKDDNYYMI